MVNKTIRYIKQYFFMLALAATFVGFSAFKYAERFEDPEDGWYEVTVSSSDPNDPDLQTINDKLLIDPAIADSTQCDQTLNDGHMCAIELTFQTGAQKPETVQEAEDDPLVGTGSQARLPDTEN